uniref:3-dehydrosphinganine reductase n=1 Tax=Rhabditophanes sp. KR3021 TaxID=114890 RepID=A0AC35UIF9_9BILA
MIWPIFIVPLAILIILVGVVYYSLGKRTKIQFVGKHALITGGSKGIGKELARELILKKCNVSIVARNENDLKEACKELNEISEKKGYVNKANWYSADMGGSSESIEKVIRNAEEKFGSVDILINNAGVSTQAAFCDLPIDAFEKQMKINYLSGVFASRAVIDGMKRKKSGTISFVSSAAGQCAIWGYTAYAPSKFAVKGFAEALNMELSPFNINVSVLYPPNTNTSGFAVELKEMPEELKIIGSSAGLFEPDFVAKELIKNIEEGEFATNIGLDGWMLGHLTSGASPEKNLISAFTQIMFSGLFRLILLCYIGYFNRVVENLHDKKEKIKKQ